MRILLPTDGSRHALAAARALSGWFDWPGGEVDVLAVVPGQPEYESRDSEEAREGATEWKGRVRRWLDDTESRLHASGLRTRTLSLSGEPSELVLAEASQGYDLVAVGVKGRSDEPFLDIDSVARALLERAPTSLLLVRERKQAGRSERLPTPQHPLKVLFAADGSAPAERAVSTYAKLAPVDRVALTVLAVADAASGGGLEETDARGVARRLASNLANQGYAATEQTQAGEAASAILDAATDADLIVMGARVPDPDVTWLGSVGLQVAGALPCSLLIVRESPPAPMPAETQVPEQPSIPFEIAYQKMEMSPLAERHILRGIARLQKVAPDLIAVRATLSQQQKRHRTGNLYHVKLRLSLPGPDIEVSRTPSSRKDDESLVFAIGEAFDKARRQVVEQRSIERGEVKTHDVPAQGEVTELFPDHGFIRASDGRVVYFHENSVAGRVWARLKVGDRVRFADEPGEEGPHATMVLATPGRSTSAAPATD